MSQETKIQAGERTQLNTPDEVAALMRTSKTETEWNANCDKVKAANGGYPPWWFYTIITSGLCHEVSQSFQK